MAKHETVLSPSCLPEAYDPREAVKLPIGARLIVTWYDQRNGGYHHGCGQVLESDDKKRVRLQVLLAHNGRKVLRLKLDNFRLMYGKLEYELRPPTEKEAETMAKWEVRYLKGKLGWRYEAKLKYDLVSSWQYWAQLRIKELLKRGLTNDWRDQARERYEQLLRRSK